jgi:type VI secretion system secreted protein VgrG
MEVVVEFLDGDPDRPLVTGCVYNGSNKPPISFPSDKTQSTIKSEISKGGGGFNEFRFEDKKGSEEIFVHGHRHLTTELIEGDETRDVKKGKRTTKIKMDDSRQITDGNDIHKIDKGNQTTTISRGDQTTKISLGKGTTTAMKSFEIKVGASSIKLEPAKITMKSVQILIDASAKLDTKAGAMANHQAGGIMTIKGALVKIN